MDKLIPFHSDLPLNCPPSLPTSLENLSPLSKQDVQPSNATKPKPVNAPPPPAPSPSTPLRSAAERARFRGRAMGGGFATINGAQMERCEQIGDAVSRGRAEAARRDDYEQFASTDADELRARGYTGRDPDDF